MRWNILAEALRDELEKIGEVSLAGVSHESVMQHVQSAPPMETSGLSKALAVLARQEMMKVAVPVGTLPDLPSYESLDPTRKKGKRSKDKRITVRVVNQTGSAAAHTIGGAGAGRLIADFAKGPGRVGGAALRRAQWKGTAIGAGVGLAAYARKKLMERGQEKQAALSASPSFSPAKALQYSRATAAVAGKTGGRFGAGPSSISRIARGSVPGR